MKKRDAAPEPRPKLPNLERTAEALMSFDIWEAQNKIDKTTDPDELAAAVREDNRIRVELGLAFAKDTEHLNGPGVARIASRDIAHVRALVDRWRVETYVYGHPWKCHAIPATTGKTCGAMNVDGGIHFRRMRCCSECGCTKSASDDRAMRATSAAAMKLNGGTDTPARMTT